MSLKDKIVVVTGGSRGLGLGLVEALVDQGAKVSVVARSAMDLEAVSARLGVKTISADITDERAAKQILVETRPDVLILNAGATPRMGPIDALSWEDFTKPWDTDVKGGLYWLQAALNLPLAAGARVLVGSSGAAQQGSPLSGGYAGAKRMLWLMAKYANGIAEQKGLGIQFQAIVPMQIIGGTGVGGQPPDPTPAPLGSNLRRFLPGLARPCRRVCSASTWCGFSTTLNTTRRSLSG
jgi:NAD(P)-dependent dehydrogenase (short-subunit alcohol dehydrogenase family)